jgi:hypothetical protein
MKLLSVHTITAGCVKRQFRRKEVKLSLQQTVERPIELRDVEDPTLSRHVVFNRFWFAYPHM